MNQGETQLDALLAGMQPRLMEGRWVFVTVLDPSRMAGLDPVCMFREGEGITCICPRSSAETAGLAFEGEYRQITLTVHSSLQAVGFLAAVSAALAKAGIPCNAVSAYYHDHLFVPSDRAEEAMAVLQALHP